MVLTDPVGDMVTRIRNANRAYHEWTEVPSARFKKELCEILKREGYLEDYRVERKGPAEILKVKLKYGPNKKRAITGIMRISKPGLRVYARKEEIPKVMGGLGSAIISTSRGLLTDKEARQKGLGGEVILYIW